MDKYNTELESISNQVQEFHTTSPGVLTLDTDNDPIIEKNIWDNVYIKYGMYVIIPIVVIVLLALSKASFTQIEYTDDDGNTTTKTSWKNVFMYGVIISIPLVVGLYIFMNKKK